MVREEEKGDSEMPMEEGDQLSYLDEEALMAAPAKVGGLLERPEVTRHNKVLDETRLLV